MPPFPLPCACPTHKLPIPKPDRFQHQSNKTYTKNISKSAVCFGKSPRYWTIVITYYSKSDNTDEVLPVGPSSCFWSRSLPVAEKTPRRLGDSSRASEPPIWAIAPVAPEKVKRSDERCGKKKPFRSVHIRFVQLSSNYLSTSSLDFNERLTLEAGQS